MSQTMIRVEKKTNYVILNKEALENANLSWKAKGLLAYLLSLPDNWQIYIDELQSHSKDGRDSTIAAMNELINANYINREQQRGERGKFSKYQYIVYEYPKPIEKSELPPETGFPETVKPEPGFPKSGSPKTVNPQLLNNNINNKLINNINKKETPEEVEENVLDFYKDCISQNISTVERKALEDFEKMLGTELVIKAIQVAALKNHKNLGYIDALVHDWSTKGFKSASEVDLYLTKWSNLNKKAKENRERQVKNKAENAVNYTGKEDSFNNYKQRDYDFDDLEKKLLGQ